MKLCLAQINTTVGDFTANAGKMLDAIAHARAQKATLVVFPEMTTTGYPPEDLLFKRGFIDENLRCLKRVAAATGGISAVIGFVDRDAAGKLYNAAAYASNGRVRAVYRKMELPNYGVFDEKRYFTAGSEPCVVRHGSRRLALTICEDIWARQGFVSAAGFRRSADIVVNLSASPYHAGKQDERKRLVRGLARRLALPVIYVNLVGGQDELVFDGGSLIYDAKGRLLAEAPRFAEHLLLASVPSRPVRPRRLGRLEEIYQALVLGTRDYLKKNGFKNALIGLSGGIDSALVARIAVDALGPAHVLGVTMPSPFTSQETLADAKLLARRLGIECREIPIGVLYRNYLETLEPVLSGMRQDLTEENLQARIRGTLLMALSNKLGHLVLTTGNKSEFATGYCTLYGDMAGGFAVLKDVPKTTVFALARYANGRPPKRSIPDSILKRPPTAELRHGQKDRDSLPPYPALDRFLERYIEKDRPAGAADRPLAGLVDRSEYKRRQAPPGVKITPKAFGRDRRMPITNRYRP